MMTKESILLGGMSNWVEHPYHKSSYGINTDRIPFKAGVGDRLLFKAILHEVEPVIKTELEAIPLNVLPITAELLGARILELKYFDNFREGI